MIDPLVVMSFFNRKLFFYHRDLRRTPVLELDPRRRAIASLVFGDRAIAVDHKSLKVIANLIFTKFNKK
ncbi:hypothetical protein AM228_18120 [Planktothricoides sp. SR001]|nr:hypothetical protein AM228_18120 [Planktothricoides sp. SR001]